MYELTFLFFSCHKTLFCHPFNGHCRFTKSWWFYISEFWPCPLLCFVSDITFFISNILFFLCWQWSANCVLYITLVASCVMHSSTRWLRASVTLTDSCVTTCLSSYRSLVLHALKFRTCSLAWRNIWFSSQPFRKVVNNLNLSTYVFLCVNQLLEQIF